MQLLFLVALASGTVNAATLAIHGSLVPPSGPVYPHCTINDNKTLEFSFGTVIGDKIDGHNYTTNVDWDYSCVDAYGEPLTIYNNLVLRIAGMTGTDPSTDHTLATSTPGLFIDILVNGGPIQVSYGEVIFTINRKPTLAAVLRRERIKTAPFSFVTLQEGNFEAWAIMIMEVR